MKAGANRSILLLVRYMYIIVPIPKNIIYIKAFCVALPIIKSNLSSLILYIEKYEIKLRKNRKTVFPSIKYNKLPRDRKPKYHRMFFILYLL